MKFELKKHPYYKDGIMCRINFDNGNGISIISGIGAYCSDNTFEIAPLINDSLTEPLSEWGDQVKGYVHPEEISKIVEFAQSHNDEEYIKFLNEFNFSNGHKTTFGDLISSLITQLDSVLDEE